MRFTVVVYSCVNHNSKAFTNSICAEHFGGLIKSERKGI